MAIRRGAQPSPGRRARSLGPLLALLLPASACAPERERAAPAESAAPPSPRAATEAPERPEAMHCDTRMRVGRDPAGEQVAAVTRICVSQDAAARD